MRQRLIALVTILTVFAITGAPALAGPYMSWGQWTSDPGVPYSQCAGRAAQAFSAVGLSSGNDGRFFHGSNGAFSVSLICYDLGNRFILTITVAQSLGTENNGMTTTQVRDQMAAVIFGAGSSSEVNLTGRYTCEGPCSSPGRTASVEQNGNDLLFISEVGGRATGRFIDARTIAVDAWGLRATISPDGRTISWTNGVRWVRQ
ncbi:MAG TPA: hypothetical protein VFO29_03940 [Candidatus Rubrimentiphilum sp.]|nr:hypothetical protein [Candidatus Rubrimentiphilum sp.]